MNWGQVLCSKDPDDKANWLNASHLQVFLGGEKMLKLTVIGLLVVLTTLSWAQTPADVIRQSKMDGPQVLDLSNTNSSVFNASAFDNKFDAKGRLNTTSILIPQNAEGTLKSTLSVLNISKDLKPLEDVIQSK